MVTFCFNRNLFLKLHVLTIGIILLTILGCKDLKTTDSQKKDFGNATERINFLTAYTGLDSSDHFLELDSLVIHTADLAFHYYALHFGDNTLPKSMNLFVLVKNYQTGNYYVNCFPFVEATHSRQSEINGKLVNNIIFGDTSLGCNCLTPIVADFFEDSLPDFKRLFSLKNWRTSIILTEIVNGISLPKRKGSQQEEKMSRQTIDSIVRFSISLPKKLDVFSKNEHPFKLYSSNDSDQLKSILHNISNSVGESDRKASKFYLKRYEKFVIEALKNDSDFLVYSGENALKIGTQCLVVALKPDYLTLAPEKRSKNLRMKYFFKPEYNQAVSHEIRLYDFCTVWLYRYRDEIGSINLPNEVKTLEEM